MIISYPTGLYKDQIPQDTSEYGDVTFIISNNTPSTSGEEFILLPLAAKLQKRSSKVWSDDQRRLSMGDLVYTISSGSSAITGSSTKLYEVGQTLEFSDEDVTEVDNNIVPRSMVIQHNTNLLDLENLGLNQAEISKIESDSAAYQKRFTDQLNALQNSIEDNKETISDLQKSINECNKAMQALQIIGDTESYNKVEASKEEFESSQQELISTVNGQITEAATLRDKILAVSQLVR